MEIELTQKPKNPIIISGFPGFGLVGMIATEYLVNHLETKQIGHIWSKELPPVIAIQDEKVIQPIQVFYNSKYNLVIIQGLAAANGSEWDIAESVMKLATTLKAKQVICLEGVGAQTEKGGDVYGYSTGLAIRKQMMKDFKPMKKGVILGIPGALLVHAENKIPASCIFAETQSNMPDSKAAAQIIKALDSYLKLKIDYKPLLKQAAEFENKLKGMMQAGQMAIKSKKDKSEELSYMG